MKKLIGLKTLILTAVAVSAILPTGAGAAMITLGGLDGMPYTRQASLSSADSGVIGSGNAGASVLNGQSFAGNSNWVERGSLTANGTSGSFTVSLTSGSWGGAPAAGTWTINDPNFWTTYGDVAISLHVGNGGGEPDHFIWEITQGALTGSWSYTLAPNVTGGGLSNLKLYTSGTGTRVPDSGATLMLFSVSMLGVGALRRRLRK